MLRNILSTLGIIAFPFRPEQYPDLDPKLRYTLAFLQNLGFVGVYAILFIHGRDIHQTSLAALTTLAMFGIGNLIGFILALPRVATEAATPAAPAPGSRTTIPDTQPKPSPIGSNNNLVDISDWITKSVLTLSIANWDKLIPALERAAAYLAVEDSRFARTEAMAIIIGYVSIGLLFAYITTRTVITPLIRDSIPVLSPQDAKAVDDAGRGAVQALDPNQHGDEPKRPNNSITPDEKATVNRVAAQIAELPVDSVRTQLDRLADAYAEIRLNQSPGSRRTAAMEEIAGKMRALCLAGAPLLNELKHAEKAGLRLAAVCILEISPDQKSMDWLAERLGLESPFVGYHAALALRELAAVIPCGQAKQLLSALDKARTAVSQDTDRSDVLVAATKLLKNRCPDIAG
jgi:hypothetical protein